jgi:hypothetical protein
MRRCIETARRGLAASLRNGLRIRVIPALAGREGEVIWGLTERHTKNDNQIYETWATERAGYQDPTSSDAEYVKSWLNLD